MATLGKYRIYFITIIILSCIVIHTLSDSSQSDERIPKQRIPPGELEFLDYKIQPSEFGGYEFVGRIKNTNAHYTLYSVEINVLFYDCLIGLGKRNCTILGERIESIYLTIPPKQERDFNEPIYIYGDVLDPKGDLVLELKVISTRSKR